MGTDQVAGVMRDLGIQGVRGGKHPITTRSVKGTGGRLDLVNRDCYTRVLWSHRGMGYRPQ